MADKYKLCTYCEGLDLGNAYWQGEEWMPEEQPHPRWTTLAFLQTSRIECSLCNAVCGYLKSALRPPGKRDVGDIDHYRVAFYRFGRIESVCKVGWRCWTDDGLVDIEMRIEPEHCGPAGVPAHFNIEDLSWEEYLVPSWKYPSSVSPSGIRLLPLDPLSMETLTLIQEWISKCMTRHEICDLENLGICTPRLPYRVLQVSEDGRSVLRLIEGKDIREDYVCLSYCWGSCSSDFVRTTKETIETFMQSIVEDSLPQTYRDAIYLTRHLGLKYIWIDAFCIIQGDTGDWVRQSRKMGDIYGNAYITIAASNSASAVDGFLKPRVQYSGYCGSYEVDNTIQRLVICPQEEREYSTLLAREPLSTRGWAMQERVLSRRIIHFCHDQIIWECAKEAALEDGSSYPLADSKSALIQGNQDDTPTSDHSSEWSQFEYFQDADHLRWERYNWISVVETYSKCHLTNPSDRLPALSGIVARLSRSLDHTYLAGHWANELPGSLMWRGTSTKPLPQSARLSGPTWAWASYPGAVTFGTCLYEGGIEMCISKVKHSSVQQATSNPYGEVSAGQIELTGRLCTAQVLLANGGDIASITFLFGGTQRSIYRQTDKDNALWFDYEVANISDIDLCVLLLGVQNLEGDTWIESLERPWTFCAGLLVSRLRNQSSPIPILQRIGGFGEGGWAFASGKLSSAQEGVELVRLV